MLALASFIFDALGEIAIEAVCYGVVHLIKAIRELI